MSESATAGIFGINPEATTTNIAPVALEDKVRGDTWPGIPQCGPISVDGAAPSSALSSVAMTFRRIPSDVAPAYTLVSGTPGVGQGQLTILDAARWTFMAPQQGLPLPMGRWHFDVQYTDAAGHILTLMIGTIRVVADYTQ